MEKDKRLRVLIACEESQRVCTEFRRLGHEAYSCDIVPESGGHPEWHIQADALQIIKLEWDLIIAHPPCTYLTAAGAIRLYDKNHNIKDEERFQKGKEAAGFFMKLYNARCDHIAVENPTPMKVFGLPHYDQAIEPFYFGDPWRKRTCLWLKGLPPLHYTDIVEPQGLWVGSTSGRRDQTVYSRYKLRPKRDQRERSKTFEGIAKAMAQQWSNYLIEEER